MNILHSFSNLYGTLFRPSHFIFQGKEYVYFDHSYNTTRSNERTVEIPIIYNYVLANKGKNILEIGNVLSHYFPIDHDVVDKYEHDKGVINEDALTFRPKKKYDLIVSISTFEHIGWDEFPRDQRKIPKTIIHLRSLLKKDGILVFSVPVAINDYLDQHLHNHTLPDCRIRCLKRVSQNNTWLEKSWEQIRYCKYDEPFANANGIVVGTVSGK